MFVDASAMVALISGERGAERIATALADAELAITSPIAVLEAVLALARPDKLDRPLPEIDRLVRRFLDERGVQLRDLPPVEDAARLSMKAAHAFRRGRRRLNICDCFH
jgi:ribonuclease VapC